MNPPPPKNPTAEEIEEICEEEMDGLTEEQAEELKQMVIAIRMRLEEDESDDSESDEIAKHEAFVKLKQICEKL